MNRYLFTYGTLMSGRKRNDILKKLFFQYVSSGKLSGFTLKHYPAGDYPVIFDGRGDCIVDGEIWAFPSIGESEWNDAMAKRILEILDQIEGVGNRLYERRVFPVGYNKEYYYYAGVPETWHNQKLVDPKYDGRHYWMGGV